jgi:hypothetical protein
MKLNKSSPSLILLHRARFTDARMFALYQLGSHAAGEKKVPAMYYNFLLVIVLPPVNDEMKHTYCAPCTT